MQKPRKRKGDKVVEELTKPHPRVKCYAEIMEVMAAGAELYYLAHPERDGDERSVEAMKCSYFGMVEMIEILDEYEISYKKEEVE